MKLPVEQDCYDGCTIMDAEGHLIATAEHINDAALIVRMLNENARLRKAVADFESKFRQMALDFEKLESDVVAACEID